MEYAANDFSQQCRARRQRSTTGRSVQGNCRMACQPSRSAAKIGSTGARGAPARSFRLCHGPSQAQPSDSRRAAINPATQPSRRAAFISAIGCSDRDAAIRADVRRRIVCRRVATVGVNVRSDFARNDADRAILCGVFLERPTANIIQGSNGSSTRPCRAAAGNTGTREYACRTAADRASRIRIRLRGGPSCLCIRAGRRGGCKCQSCPVGRGDSRL